MKWESWQNTVLSYKTNLLSEGNQINILSERVIKMKCIKKEDFENMVGEVVYVDNLTIQSYPPEV